MEPRQRANLAYMAIIAVLVVTAGALFIGYRGLSEEGDRLAASNRSLGEETARLGAANRSLAGERDALKGEVQAQRARVDAVEAELKTAREQISALGAERDLRAASAGAAQRASSKLQDELDALRKAHDESQQQARGLAADKESLEKKLAAALQQAGAAAAGRAEVARELKASAQTLDEARARSARLNKAYEGLLRDRSRLAASNAAQRAELAKTRDDFEAAQAELARLTGARGIYTVQNADSLSTIAAFFYRNGNRWPDVFKANDFLIEGPDLIYPGQVLIVPK